MTEIVAAASDDGWSKWECENSTEAAIGRLRACGEIAGAALRSAQQPAPQTSELDKVRNLICEYWNADEQANAHKTICDLHDVLFPLTPTIRRKQRAAPTPPHPDPAEEIARLKEAMHKANEFFQVVAHTEYKRESKSVDRGGMRRVK